MPGPGWWIASDGRWYPPELHPDVGASAAVIVEDPTPPTSPSIASSPSSFEVSHDVSHQKLSRDKEEFLASLRSSNGSYVATRELTKTTAATQPARPSRQRLVLSVGLAVGTLAVIIYLARGHDVRPSLDSRAATTVPATTVQDALAAPSSSPAATSASSAPSSTAPSATTTPASTASTVTSATSVTSAAKVTPRVVSVFELVTGNCLDGASLSDGLITTIRVVDCSEVHTHEVFYSGRYPDTTFDSTKISDYAHDTCLTQFTPYVGIDYTRSRYEYLHIVPTQESWTRDNDRDVVCVAFENDATLTGSIAGRAQ